MLSKANKSIQTSRKGEVTMIKWGWRNAISELWSRPGSSSRSYQSSTSLEGNFNADFNAELFLSDLRRHFADCFISIKHDDPQSNKSAHQSAVSLCMNACMCQCCALLSVSTSVSCQQKKKTSRYQQPRFPIMFPPPTHSACLMIPVLKPGKLPSPKPDILQFVSHLLLLFLPHYPGPLPHFPSCNIQLPRSAVLIFSCRDIFSKSLNFFPLFCSNEMAGSTHSCFVFTQTHTHTH